MYPVIIIMEVVMKKIKFLATAGVIASAAVIFAGCSGISGINNETTLSEEATQTTTAEKETTTNAETTTSEATVTTETTASETASEAESVETVTAYNEGSSSEGESNKYSIEIIRSAEGFEKTGDLSCSSDTAEYTYSILNDVTSHDIEARLDNEASSLTDSDTGRIGDVLYASGRSDNGYTVTAYTYIGTGSSVSTFAGVKYLSENEVSPLEVVELLSEDYISY